MSAISASLMSDRSAVVMSLRLPRGGQNGCAIWARASVRHSSAVTTPSQTQVVTLVVASWLYVMPIRASSRYTNLNVQYTACPAGAMHQSDPEVREPEVGE